SLRSSRLRLGFSSTADTNRRPDRATNTNGTRWGWPSPSIVARTATGETASKSQASAGVITDGSLDDGDDRSVADGVARLDPQIDHCPGSRRLHFVLHLHRLEHAYRVPDIDGLARPHVHLDDRPLHGSGHHSIRRGRLARLQLRPLASHRPPSRLGLRGPESHREPPTADLDGHRALLELQILGHGRWRERSL